MLRLVSSRRAAPLALSAALAAASVACGAMPQATPAPVVVVVTATAAPVSPTVPASAPASPTNPPLATSAPTQASASPTAGATISTSEGLRSAPTAAPSVPASSSSTSEGLKPRPTATPAAAPTQKPQPASPTEKPQPTTSDGKPSLAAEAAKLRAQPTPVPARKGQPNPNVSPEAYVTEIANDANTMSQSLTKLSQLFDAVEQTDSLSDEEASQVVAVFQKEANAVREVYAREVARDYPPELKEIDDYYVETVRYASRFVDLFLQLMQSGDESLAPQLVESQGKFEFFGNELVARLNKLGG